MSKFIADTVNLSDFLLRPFAYDCQYTSQLISKSSQVEVICDKLQSTLGHFGRGFFIFTKLKVITMNLNLAFYKKG